MAPEVAPEPDWDAWTSDLHARIVGLRDGQVVTASARIGGRVVTTKGARMLGMRPAQRELAHPFVRFLRAEDHLRGYCIGSSSWGGAFPWDPHEEVAIKALGWHQPSALESPMYLRYWPDDVATALFLPHDLGYAAARLAAQTIIEIFRCDHPEGVELSG